MRVVVDIIFVQKLNEIQGSVFFNNFNHFVHFFILKKGQFEGIYPCISPVRNPKCHSFLFTF